MLDTSSLSPREKQILTHILRGASVGDIASSFGTSKRTVQVQIARLLQIFRVSNQKELMALVLADMSERTGVAVIPSA